MEEIKKLLKEVLNREFIRAVISSPKEKEGTAVLLECGTEPVQGILKIKVRPLEKRGELMFQLEAFTKTQAFHRNLNPEAAGDPGCSDGAFWTDATGNGESGLYSADQ